VLGIGEPDRPDDHPQNPGGGLLLELLCIFFAGPVLLRLFHPPAPKLLLLLLVFAGCVAVLHRDGAFDRTTRVDWERLRREAPLIGVRALLAAASIAAITLWRGEPLLAFPRGRPLLFAAVVVLYPWLSALPQEVIYRTFFFHRYGRVLGPTATVLASAAAFSILHVIYADPIAMVLSLPGGLVLAGRYARARSLAAVTTEHALYGLAVFALGLGRAFFVLA
jgi:membrane protease YdiL (CAAX protease family)